MRRIRTFVKWLRSSGLSRGAVSAVFVTIALAPKLLTHVGFRLLDDPVVGTIAAVLVAEFRPLAGFGFVVLLVYLLVSEYVETGSTSELGTKRRLSTLLGVAVAFVYTMVVLALWIDPHATGTVLIGAIKGTSRAIYTSSLATIVDPVFVRSVEFALVSLIRNIETALLRNPGRPLRWPLYLFVAYVTVSELIEEASWFDGSTGRFRYSIRCVGAASVLVYGLVFAHNFFPGRDSLPWSAETMAAWLVIHSVLTIVVLVLCNQAIPTERYRTPSFVGITALVYLLLGIGIAVLDGLYPVPEVVLLGTALLVLIERVQPLPLRENVAVRVTDVVSQFSSGLAEAWSDPTKLFAASMAVEGFFLAGWLIWALLFSVDSPLGSATTSFPVALFVVLAFSPVLVATTYVMWYWLAEIKRLDAARGSSRRGPDLLAFPTMVLMSFFGLQTAMESGLHLTFLVVCGILVGLVGMYSTLRGSLSDRSLPQFANRYAVPMAFLVQFGGLVVASRLTSGFASTSTSYLDLLIVTLVPLYVYSLVRKEAPKRMTDLRIEASIVVGTVLVTVVVLLQDWSINSLNGAVIGLAAVGLAVIMTIERIIAVWDASANAADGPDKQPAVLRDDS